MDASTSAKIAGPRRDRSGGELKSKSRTRLSLDTYTSMPVGLDNDTGRAVIFLALNQSADRKFGSYAHDLATTKSEVQMLSDVALLPSATRLLEEITSLVSRAAAAILSIDIDHVAKRLKSDLSPVTAADEVAQAVILEGLSRLLPGIPVISEEASKQWPVLQPGSPFLLVDPLDGT